MSSSNPPNAPSADGTRPPAASHIAAARLISIIVPVFNEERNVQPAYDALTAVFRSLEPRYRFEIVFTDNHSTDGTFSILRTIAARDRSVRVLRFARNFGINKSILTGFRQARGDAAIQIDCDLQDPPALIPEFLARWEEGYDVVVGVRRKRDEGFFLEQYRRLFYRLLSRMSEDPIVVDAGEFRLVDRHILDQLNLIDDAYPFVRALVSSLARKQTGIPYDRAQRMHGRSKFPLRRLLGYALEGLLGHTILPLRIASYVGLAVATLAMCLSGYYVVERAVLGSDWPSGFTTTAILLLFGISLNAIFLGIIGEYVGRIYVQLRRRPTVVVEARLNCYDAPPAV